MGFDTIRAIAITTDVLLVTIQNALLPRFTCRQVFPRGVVDF